MNANNADTRLDHFALGFVVLYFPIETWGSWPELWHPFYLDAVIGMLLLLWGIAKFRSGRRSALGVLCAGFAWMSATGWRSTFDRVFALAEGRATSVRPLGNVFRRLQHRPDDRRSRGVVGAARSLAGCGLTTTGSGRR
jgi:hypothetical protein